MHETRDLNQNTQAHMSDGDRVMDCLWGAKELAMLYAGAALESTNNGMREFFLAMQNEETHSHEVLFSFLHTRGYYPTEMVSKDRVNDVQSRARQMHEALGLTDEPSERHYRTADPKLPPSHLQNHDSYAYKDDH